MAGLSGKRWMVSLTAEQYEWIKETEQATNLKGSQIIRAIIERVMEEKGGTFRRELANEHLKLKLQRLNDQQAAIEEERLKITRALKGGDKVPA